MNEAVKLLQEADKILELGNSGFALVAEVDECEKKLKDFLVANTSTNNLFGRKFDKWNSGTHWKTAYPGKYATKDYLGMLQSLRDFLAELLELSDIELPVEQQLVKSRAVYTGSRIIRETLGQATQKIDIQDNFVGTRFLDILEQIIMANPNLKIRLLTKNGNYRDLKPFIQELPLFQQQFTNLTVKSHDQAHGRFIIIDGNKVFSPGASLKDIGKKADLFSEVTVNTAKQELISDFESWWSVGQEGVNIK
jgi:hypothetical protein